MPAPVMQVSDRIQDADPIDPHFGFRRSIVARAFARYPVRNFAAVGGNLDTNAYNEKRFDYMQRLETEQLDREQGARMSVTVRHE